MLSKVRAFFDYRKEREHDNNSIYINCIWRLSFGNDRNWDLEHETDEGADDFFLGGRGLSAPVAAMSAQASDMSGWLLMGLPGSVYALGTGQAWIAVGLGLGTIANWLIIARHFVHIQL